MGIDRHELEHRNWRSSTSIIQKEATPDIGEDAGTSIVPQDAAGKIPRAKSTPRAKREKID